MLNLSLEVFKFFKIFPIALKRIRDLNKIMPLKITFLFQIPLFYELIRIQNFVAGRLEN